MPAKPYSPSHIAAVAGGFTELRLSGAVKAMGLSLGQMADELKKGSGERIAMLDPAKIEASMVADRLTVEALLDEGFEALKESLKTHGQQVPVLVRTALTLLVPVVPSLLVASLLVVATLLLFRWKNS